MTETQLQESKLEPGVAEVSRTFKNGKMENWCLLTDEIKVFFLLLPDDNELFSVVISFIFFRCLGSLKCDFLGGGTFIIQNLKSQLFATKIMYSIKTFTHFQNTISNFMH